MKNKITIDDIAEYVGVSKTSVSFVLNRKSGVSESTRKKIIEAIKHLNYKPQLNLSYLDSEKRTILFLQVQLKKIVLAEQHRLYFATSYLNGAQARCDELGFNLEQRTVTDLNKKELKSIISGIENLQGIVILGTELESEKDFSIFQSILLPVVFIDTFHPYLNLNFVNIDNNSGVFTAIHHLKTLGHNNIGLATSLDESYNFKMREESFHYACKYFGIDFNPEWIYKTHCNYEKGKEEFEEIFSGKDNYPTALFCVCDLIALSLHNSLTKLGYKIPEDISIIGFDNLDVSSMVAPTLTTIDVPKNQIGRQAIQLLVDRIYNYYSPSSIGYELNSERILISNNLIKRESTCSI